MADLCVDNRAMITVPSRRLAGSQSTGGVQDLCEEIDGGNFAPCARHGNRLATGRGSHVQPLSETGKARGTNASNGVGTDRHGEAACSR